MRSCWFYGLVGVVFACRSNSPVPLPEPQVTSNYGGDVGPDVAAAPNIPVSESAPVPMVADGFAGAGAGGVGGSGGGAGGMSGFGGMGGAGGMSGFGGIGGGLH